MINTLKWELRKHILHLRWVIIPMVIILGILFLIPVPTSKVIESGHSLDLTLSLISFLVMICFTYLIVIYPTISTIDGLVKKHGLLEKMDSRSYLTIGLVKIVLNVVCVLVASGLLMLILDVIRKFDVTDHSYLILELKVPFQLILFSTAVLLPTMALLSVMVAGSVKILRESSIISALILFVASIWLLVQAQNLESGIATIIQVVIVMISFVVSCWLYDNKYEMSNI